MKGALLERALKRDRAVVIAGLLVVTAAAWGYILAGAGMNMGAQMPMAATASPWGLSYFILMLAMWWVMMVAMMLPSAAPMILLFATINRNTRAKGGTAIPSGVFAAGYLLVWGGFSLLATTMQWGLDHLRLLSPMMTTTSVTLGGFVLVAAGIYQLTPLKQACLNHCRSPLDFVTTRWRTGRWGALRMGIEHGLFCVGCCWVLMALLFYGGVMNLYWIIGIALYVLIEKAAPLGPTVGRYSGALLIAWGAWVLVG